MTPDEIREKLKHHKYYIIQHGLERHPGNGSKLVRAKSIFAQTKELLEEAIKQETEYKVWIAGEMEDIPAAYLYKEVT